MLLALNAPVVHAQSPQEDKPAPAKVESPLETKTYEMNNVPWGVAVDGDTIYFTMPGKDISLTERLEDGYIAVIRPGETKPELLTEAGYLISPRGIYVDGDALVITDVDHVYKIDKETGKMITYFSLSTDGPLSGMTSVAKMDDRLIAACMDQNRLYFIDETSVTFAELVTSEPLNSPSGIVWDSKNQTLYVCEAAVEVDRRGKETPVGRILAVNPVDGKVTEIMNRNRELRGQFVGLALRDGDLYFSDWSKDKTPEAIRKYNLERERISNVATSAMQGVAQFVLRGNQIIIPAAKEKKIIVANLPENK